MNTPENSVVVGVGADGSEVAIRFGIAEARQRHVPLHLVHVCQLPAGDAYAGIYTDMVESGKAVLRQALAQARAEAGDDVALTDDLVVTGWVVDELVRRTEKAGLLVLQHRDLGRVRRALGGSVAQSVAGRARVPVMSVPEGWDPKAAATHGVVTAAVQDPVEAGHLLRAAFQEAQDRGAVLVVLHAWWLATGFDAIVVNDGYGEERAAQTREELQPVLAPLRAEFPDVEVAQYTRHAPPAEAVLDASAKSDLLVIGRRHHLLPLGTHLGPVARASLGHSSWLPGAHHARDPSRRRGDP